VCERKNKPIKTVADSRKKAKREMGVLRKRIGETFPMRTWAERNIPQGKSESEACGIFNNLKMLENFSISLEVRNF
jgi:hypothetical protein